MTAFWLVKQFLDGCSSVKACSEDIKVHKKTLVIKKMSLCEH